MSKCFWIVLLLVATSLSSHVSVASTLGNVSAFSVSKSTVTDGDTVTLSWQKPPGYTEDLYYNIYVTKPGSNRWKFRSDYKWTSISRYMEGIGTHNFEVEVCNTNDECGPSSSIKSVEVIKPNPVRSLKASKYSVFEGEVVTLSWLKPSVFYANAKYNIYTQKPVGSRFTFKADYSWTSVRRYMSGVGTHRFFVEACNAKNMCSSVQELSVIVKPSPPNTPPSISPIFAQNTVANTAFTASFNVSDVETAANSLVVTATTDNLALIPNNNIELSGSGNSRFITITPANNMTGSTVITLTVTDSGGLVDSESFAANVMVINEDFTGTADAFDSTGSEWRYNANICESYRDVENSTYRKNTQECWRKYSFNHYTKDAVFHDKSNNKLVLNYNVKRIPLDLYDGRDTSYGVSHFEIEKLDSNGNPTFYSDNSPKYVWGEKVTNDGLLHCLPGEYDDNLETAFLITAGYATSNKSFLRGRVEVDVEYVGILKGAQPAIWLDSPRINPAIGQEIDIDEYVPSIYPHRKSMHFFNVHSHYSSNEVSHLSCYSFNYSAGCHSVSDHVAANGHSKNIGLYWGTDGTSGEGGTGDTYTLIRDGSNVVTYTQEALEIKTHQRNVTPNHAKLIFSIEVGKGFENNNRTKLCEIIKSSGYTERLNNNENVTLGSMIIDSVKVYSDNQLF
ncbi:hypothetical protein [Pseudoalteromonas luteoviolacea]|uniref:Fibronectin type-III domain-containing protein n=1 Tax=Pseudoalteromonas luteoviolacea S4054 TaxID=1129367 RepID=A0A0F6A653_9GAMM|nr:hypothetical protein [Pseudoalteromonas luteoviolacea]AOT07737.1 hypothetical protein S4054249_07725 [Pseudoalteromonas luteoviolacea]AOT12653.1 hypothetical protein S40542_07725 [Pseudoalteromonas luteoviolacea]AOT17566.1 hypothetical protein S4054_07720 [Pseudoalteromonas luteoviolacea]KKE81598.1 hypothetical protein N479_22130 [Pseudoalteromonas luteoviolacea S4054]KZN78866.1 hypothetical protein N481_00055 [Pseudoalteromonas luteoviolacea S4047-1]